jgi:type IV secretory pathway TrbD component
MTGIFLLMGLKDGILNSILGEKIWIITSFGVICLIIILQLSTTWLTGINPHLRLGLKVSDDLTYYGLHFHRHMVIFSRQ